MSLFPFRRFRSAVEEVCYAGELQHSADGCVLRFAARVEASVRRSLDLSGLPAGRGRPDQRRRLQGSPADPRPQGPGPTRVAQASRQGHGRSRDRRRSEELRSRRLVHAGTAISLARRARTARCGGEIARALHVDHEHAAAALYQAHSWPRLRGAEARLYRPDRLGQLRSQDDHAQQPGPASHSSAGREGQLPSGDAADQLQMRQVR